MQLPAGLEITWLGHSTFRIVTPSGKRLLIDPWLQSNPACPEELHDPGELDLILVTHGHNDHTGPRDLLEIAKSTGATIGTMIEIGDWLAGEGIPEDNIIGFNKGGTVEAAGCRVHMTHAVHSSSVTLEDGRTLYMGEAAGFVIEFENGFKVYHSGDTAVFSDMALIGKLLQPDWAMLCIGDHFTMGPRSAAEAIRLLNVKTVIPMHYGTFPVLTGTPAQLREHTTDIEGLEIVEMEPGDTLS